MSADPPLLILAPRMTEDSKTIWKSALELGWSTQRVHGWRVPEEILSTSREIVIYGEPLFAEAVADQMSLVLLEPSINWLTHIPRAYLLRDIEIMDLAKARLQTTPAFVKPADGKIFDPKVYPSGDDLPTDEQVDGDILVLRSGIVDFRLEVRCFIQHRQLLTLSPYWRDGKLAQDAEGLWPFLKDEEPTARKFAERVLLDDRIPLPPACTLDIGLTSTGEWAIVEANPCWGAGLYGCDAHQVLSCLSTTIIRSSDLRDQNLTWINPRRRSIIN